MDRGSSVLFPRATITSRKLPRIPRRHELRRAGAAPTVHAMNAGSTEVIIA